MKILAEQGPSRELLIDKIQFQEESAGFVMFTPETFDPAVFTHLRSSITNGIQSVLLRCKLQDQAKELTEKNEHLIRYHAQEQEYLRAIKRELNLASQIQADFLPRSLPELPGWEVSVMFQPAKEVAGDFYDLFMLPEHKTAVVIADVCGKSSALRCSWRWSEVSYTHWARGFPDPSQVISRVNDYIIRNHNQSRQFMFVTIFYGVLDTTTKRFVYVNAGHPAPYIVNGNGIRNSLDRNSAAVGIHSKTSFSVSETEFGKGEMLFAFTDGVTEAQDKAGTLLGKDRLQEVLCRKQAKPDQLIGRVQELIAEHRGGHEINDDVTMLAMRRA
jgi:sigma-B regulation protein RsbU (phosphoserine phosphatase)